LYKEGEAVNETTELIMKQLNSKKVHAETHEVGGGDEIDVLKLKNVGSLETIDHSGKHEIGGSDEIDVLKLRNIDTFVTKTGDFKGTWNGTELNVLKADTALLFGSSVSNVTFSTDANSNITGIQEKNGSNTLANTSWTYNADGTVNTITEVIGSQTIVSTFHYVNGVLDPTNPITRSVS
jgi:hypothetical protein